MLDFLKSKLAAPIAAGLCLLSAGLNVGLGLKVWAQSATIVTLTDTNTKLAGDLATSRLNAARLEGAVMQQNAAVDGLAAAAESAKAAAEASQHLAELDAREHDRAAAALGALPALPAGADHCAAASELIHTTLAGEKAK